MTQYALTEPEPTVHDVGFSYQAGEDRPDTPSLAVMEMRERWDLLNSLWGGTRGMRAAGTKWLPQETQETDAAYRIRLNRSVCMGAFRETVLRHSSSPFRRPVSIRGEGLPDWVGQLSRNVNKSGRDLTQFAHEVFWAGWFFGHGVMMGEAPESGQTRGQGVGGSVSNAYLVDIPPSRILGWDVDYAEDGSEVLVELRVLEYSTERVGNFSERRVKRVRVYRQPLRDRSRSRNTGAGLSGDGTVQSFVSVADSDAWEVGEVMPYNLEGPNGGLPVFPAYVNYIGPLQSEPPLEDLAWQNLKHWQSESDQRNILRFIRVATMFASGMTKEEVAQIVIGANRITHSDNEQAELSYVEHSGKGAEAGAADLDRIEATMERLGMAPLLRDSAKVTATGQTINANGTNSLLEQSAKALENALDGAFRWLALIRGEQLPDDFRISVMDQFDVPVMNGANKQDILLRSAVAGMLPLRAYLEELQRDGFISAHVSVDMLVDEIEAQREREMVAPEPFGEDE